MAKMKNMMMETVMTRYSFEEWDAHVFFRIFTTKMVLDTTMSGVKTRKLRTTMKTIASSRVAGAHLPPPWGPCSTYSLSLLQDPPHPKTTLCHSYSQALLPHFPPPSQIAMRLPSTLFINSPLTKRGPRDISVAKLNDAFQSASYKASLSFQYLLWSTLCPACSRLLPELP